MRLKVVKKYELFDEVMFTSIQRHDDCMKHNHILKYFDFIKINNAIKEVVVEEVIKGYALANINRLLQDTKWSANSVALR